MKNQWGVGGGREVCNRGAGEEMWPSRVWDVETVNAGGGIGVIVGVVSAKRMELTIGIDMRVGCAEGRVQSCCCRGFCFGARCTIAKGGTVEGWVWHVVEIPTQPKTTNGQVGEGRYQGI